MMKTLLLVVLFSIAIRAQVQPAPPNATACIVGISKCDGSDNNCICQHGGHCVGPDLVKCACDTPNVWNGTYCHEPLCVGSNFPKGGCVHGICDTPGHCTCEVGYRGFDCSISLPCGNGCTSTGDCACLNGGSCTDTNVCNCPLGYASDFCEIAVCEGGCGQGNCISPGVCQCNSGYNGTRCEKAICDPPCEHGPCTAPFTCDCFGTGYSHCPGGHQTCGCDENECLRGEQPCDALSKCDNLIGNYTCSPCPAGTAGTPYLEYPFVPLNKTYYTGGCKAVVASSATVATTQTTVVMTTADSTATSSPTTATSATTVATSAATTATSATNAATSATNAATSATNAATSATNAATSSPVTATSANAQTNATSMMTSANSNATSQAASSNTRRRTSAPDDVLSNAVSTSIALLLVAALL